MICPICGKTLCTESKVRQSCPETETHKYNKLNFPSPSFTDLVVIKRYIIYFYPTRIIGHRLDGKNHFTINQPIKPCPNILDIIENHLLLS